MLLNKDNNTLTLTDGETKVLKLVLAKYMSIISHFGPKSEDEWTAFCEVAKDLDILDKEGDLPNGSKEKSSEEKSEEVINNTPENV